MGKGDSQEMQQAINTQQNQGNQWLNTIKPAQQSMYSSMANNYSQGTGMNMPDYNSIMNSYRTFLGGGNPTGGSSSPTYQPQQSQTGYTSFRNPDGSISGTFNPQQPDTTGGYSTGTITGPKLDTGQSGGSQGMMNGYQPLPNATYNQGSSLPNFDANMSNDQVQQLVQQYAAQSGGSMGDGGAYWVNLWNQWGKGDPNYFRTKLVNGLVTDGGATNTSVFGTQSGAGGWGPGTSGYSGSGSSGGGGDNSSAIGGFQNFAETGGFSPQDIADIRARAIAPTRAIYQNAQNDLSTQMARTGGYMPNYAPAQANLARQANYGISDANINANAAIDQMVQQGKLYGLTGMSNAQLGALSGMTGMYGTTPALSSTFGNQVLNSGSQGIDIANSQNNLANILLNAKYNQSQIPGNFQQAAGNVGSAVQMAAMAAMLFA